MGLIYISIEKWELKDFKYRAEIRNEEKNSEQIIEEWSERGEFHIVVSKVCCIYI